MSQGEGSTWQPKKFEVKQGKGVEREHRFGRLGRILFLKVYVLMSRFGVIIFEGDARVMVYIKYNSWISGWEF